jgi:FkbM family methyltransferase
VALAHLFPVWSVTAAVTGFVPPRSGEKSLKRAIAASVFVLGRNYVRFSPLPWGKTRVYEFCRDYINFYDMRRVVRTTEGVKLYCSSEDLIQSFIMYFGMWDPHITRYLQARLQPGDVLVDVGANIGYYTLLGSKLVGPAGKVVAIEASPRTYASLQQNIERNRAENVRAVNAAASNQRGTVQVFAGTPDNIGGTSIMPRHGAVEATVDAFPLADLLDSEELARASVIKIDVEGAEAFVLRGLLDSADRIGKATEIIVEITPDWISSDGTSAEDLLDEFRALGFHTYELRTQGTADYLSKPRNTVHRRIDTPITEQTDVLLSRRSDLA